MIRAVRTLATAAFAALLLVGLAGCTKKEGPAEKAGKEVDKAVVSAGEKVEKAGDNIKDAAKGEKK